MAAFFGKLSNMSNFYAQIDSNGRVFSVVESPAPVIDDNVIECHGFDVLGHQWDGEKFEPVPVVPRYKVWSKPEFILILGQSVFEAINTTSDSELQFFKYVLDNAPYVDMNDERYRAMVQKLLDVGLITQNQFNELTVQE